MHFKRFFKFKPNNNSLFIIFNDKKVLFDLEEKTFIFDEAYLNFENYDLEIIGIAKDEGKNIYAVDVTSSNFNYKEQGYKSLIDYDLRFILTSLSNNEINLIGRANQLLHWIKSNKYCGYCGSAKKFNEEEQALFCDCNKIMIYPSISPCVLALIQNGNQILLARNALFPEGLFSALAGFIEVSETAEETIEREIFEEVRLKVKNIKYFGSQSWPFPSQLMLAYTCEFDSGEIEVDGQEIVEAKWFDLNNLPNTPPNSTLSGRLINSCILDR